jgi:dinuclear metal center YbgI/SA1388 family protein
MPVLLRGPGRVLLHELVRYLNSYLRIAEIPDDPRALNGLQFENSGSIKKIAAAVDACQATIEMSIAAGANLLLVHHGLFWSGVGPMTGVHARRIRSMVTGSLALYSAHLPLDCHPEVGNNYVLARNLGVRNLEPFGEAEGIKIGVAGDLEISVEELEGLLRSQLGATPRVIQKGGGKVTRIAIITGAGSSEIGAAAAAGVDTFLTGEGPHHTYLQAEELGINLIYAGHYATETVGVQALAKHLSSKFELPWEFLDHPTGM